MTVEGRDNIAANQSGFVCRSIRWFDIVERNSAVSILELIDAEISTTEINCDVRNISGFLQRTQPAAKRKERDNHN